MNFIKVENKFIYNEIVAMALIVVLKILIRGSFNFPNELYQKNRISYHDNKKIEQFNKYMLNIKVINDIQNIIRQFSRNAINVCEKGLWVTSDKILLKSYLLEYVNEMGWNYDYLKKEFIASLNKTSTLNSYPITELKYVPFIILNYLKNEKFIKNILIEPQKWMVNKLGSEDYNFSSSFIITVEANSFIDKIENPDKLDNIGKNKIKNKLTQNELEILSRYKYIKDTLGENPTYKRIVDLSTNIKLTESAVKQRAKSIKEKLDVSNIGEAIYELGKHNIELPEYITN